MKRYYFRNRTKEKNPIVIMRNINPHSGYTFDEQIVQGVFFRVFPTQDDYPALCMMQHRVDKFAPAEGNGVLIREEIINQLDA
jgi:hypothetical protein